MDLRDTCDPLADLSTGLIPGAGLSMEANEMSDDADPNAPDGSVRVEVFSEGANGAGGWETGNDAVGADFGKGADADEVAVSVAVAVDLGALS